MNYGHKFFAAVFLKRWSLPCPIHACIGASPLTSWIRMMWQRKSCVSLESVLLSHWKYYARKQVQPLEDERACGEKGENNQNQRSETWVMPCWAFEPGWLCSRYATAWVSPRASSKSLSLCWEHPQDGKECEQIGGQDNYKGKTDLEIH